MMSSRDREDKNVLQADPPSGHLVEVQQMQE
jgi:hypothetical protein